MADAVARMITAADLRIEEMAVVHVHDPLVPGAPHAAMTHAIRTPQDGLRHLLGRLLEQGDMVEVTADRAIDGYEALLEREQLAGWLAEADASASLEGGSGLLVGYDPLNPERRVATGDVVIHQAHVELAGETLFSWKEVARASACRGSDTARYLLVDGRAVFLHADVDWDNRLS